MRRIAFKALVWQEILFYGLESNYPKIKFQAIKVTVQKSIAELFTIISNHLIKYQVPHALFYQINDHKHDIYLYEKLSIKLLAQAANKNTKFTLSMVSKLTVQKLVSILDTYFQS